jgi:hypothetical protein
MRYATLTREESTDQGTFGRLETDSGLTLRTGELPWRDNASGKSCIPPGTYTVTFRNSPKHGPCYHVENVPGRTDIEIHSANWMGDREKGFRCELLGCIAPGVTIGNLSGQRAVISSRMAISMLEEAMGRETFELTILKGEELRA